MVCPFDNTQVKCILEARAGDLKYSLEYKPHNGWLLCNGSTYSTTMYAELYAVLKSSFGSRLPNYNGYFLKAASGSNGTALSVSEAAGLPNITGEVGYYNGGGFFNDKGKYFGAFTRGSSSSYILIGGDASGANLKFDASKSNSIYGSSSTVTPKNYAVNVFIYTGRYY